MEKPKTTPKDFFLWAGAMLTLYGGVVALITLLFNYVNYSFPDPLRYYSDPYSSGMPYQMASLIVLAPVFLLVMRLIRASIAADPTRGEIWIRRWALFLTVFLAGATIIIDLIVLLTTFLQGEELTIAFLLKVVIVLCVAGAGFMHFLADLRGYWAKYPRHARMVNYAVGLLVISTVFAGFVIVGSPAEARQYRLDQQKINDLQTIQWQLVNYWQTKQELPSELNELNDAISGFRVPLDKETGQPYGYEKTGSNSFKLCATFKTESTSQAGRNERSVPMPVVYGGMSENWQHGTGNVCFDRTIDPERYPPTTKPIR